MIRYTTSWMAARIPLCAALVFAGCNRQVAQQPARPAPQPRPEMKAAPPTPIAVTKQELGEQSWDPQWDVIVEQALSPEMLSPRVARGVRSYCPRFAAMTNADKRAFWAYTFQAIAAAEAGLKPTTNVRHTEPEVAVIDTVTKRTVRQEGLLQLTYMDSQRYGCDFDWQADKTLPEHDPNKSILQPKNNLLCGIKILDNQLNTLHKPLLSKSSYWVTLRPGTLSYLLFMKQMKNVPSACGPTPIRHGWFSRQTLPPGAQVETTKPTTPATPAAAVASASAASQAKTTGQRAAQAAPSQ